MNTQESVISFFSLSEDIIEKAGNEITRLLKGNDVI
jgi:hypothetical protein